MFCLNLELTFVDSVVGSTFVTSLYHTSSLTPEEEQRAVLSIRGHGQVCSEDNPVSWLVLIGLLGLCRAQRVCVMLQHGNDFLSLWGSLASLP